MERKIGEIFEYNGEWCQCVKGNGCEKCIFNKKKCYTFISDDDPIGYCEADKREDKQDVIFRKLEKVGDPIMLSGKWIQKISIPNQDNCDGCCYNMDECMRLGKGICGASEIYVEIKQNKEDMEENELIELLSEKVHNAWMKEKEAQGFSYGKEYDKEKKKHPDMLPYNELKEEVKEYDRATVKAVLQAQKELSADANKLNLKPFSLEAAKAGKPVCTRDGRKARIICFDKKDNQCPIVALVDYYDKKDGEAVTTYTNEGFFCIDEKHPNDLMMLPEKKEGWVNVYKRENEYICENECSVSTGIAVYKSESEAKRNIDKNEIYVNTIKIIWEE